jgi:hypothetical protein
VASALGFRSTENFRDLPEELVGVEWPHDESVDARLPREHPVARLLSDEHDAHTRDAVGHRRSNRVEQLEVLPDAAGRQIEYDAIDLADAELTHRLIAVVSALDAMAGIGEQPAQELARGLVVVDDKDLSRPGSEVSLRMLGLRRSP